MTKDGTAALLERHFDAAFSAPNGIKKLRELILTLAMQGRLVEQDPNDPPASDLLREIEKEKSSREAKGRRSKDDLPPIKPEEVPYELPRGWQWVRLGDVAHHNSGKTLDRGRNTGQMREYITTSNLYWGRFELNSLRQMPIRDDELEKCTAQKGDLLICEGGEAGRAAVWNFEDIIHFQNHIHRVRFFAGVDSFFYFRFFEKLNASGEIEQYRKGVGIASLSSRSLSSIVLPLPPLPEQHRIVAKIDQLMARCDELEKLRKVRDEKRLAVHAAAIKQLLEPAAPSSVQSFLSENFGELYAVKENVAEVRKAILQLGVMGRLVEQDPNDPPASELLKEIEKEKSSREGKSRRSKDELPPIKPEEMPYELPKGWQWVRLGEVALSIDYGTSEKTCDDSSLLPVYRMGNIVEGRLVDAGFKYISRDIEDLPRLYLQTNDILFNRTNSFELVGKSALYSGPNERATFASYLIRIRPFQKLFDAKFLIKSMNAPYFRQTQIEPEIVQQCGQANFNGTKLSFCLLPLPPLPEQHRIVAKIVQLMALCDALDRQIDAATGKQTEILNAVMAQV